MSEVNGFCEHGIDPGGCVACLQTENKQLKALLKEASFNCPSCGRHDFGLFAEKIAKACGPCRAERDKYVDIIKRTLKQVYAFTGASVGHCGVLDGYDPEVLNAPSIVQDCLELYEETR